MRNMRRLFLVLTSPWSIVWRQRRLIVALRRGGSLRLRTIIHMREYLRASGRDMEALRQSLKAAERALAAIDNASGIVAQFSLPSRASYAVPKQAFNVRRGTVDPPWMAPRAIGYRADVRQFETLGVELSIGKLEIERDLQPHVRRAHLVLAAVNMANEAFQKFEREEKP